MAELERFELPEELEEFRRLVRTIAEERIEPRAAEIDETDEWPEDVYKVLVENDLMGVGYPEEHGGSGGGSLAFGVFIEELSRVSAGVSLTPLVSKLGVIPLVVAGDDAKAKQMTEGIARGDVLMSYALTEPGAGSDPAAMTTRYERDGDEFVLSGTKRFITGAGVSHGYVVFATKDPSTRAKGVSAFLVMRDDPGVSFGRKEDKMGIRGSPTREVICDGARVPADRLIGDEGEGFAYAMRTLDYSRPAIAAQALGIAQGAFDFAARYATERQQFGKPIGEFQGVSFMVADMAMQLEAARMLVYKSLALCDAGDERMTYFSSVAKCFASDAAMRITTDAVQVLGGYGYIREYPVERYMRDAKITQIYEGTNQIQRVVIARELLKAFA
ncbi:MAG TPA: acyl-CoA dehydrogenase family protein [Actinomycetota bacterium]|jgi:alkylation response protein AidB-like acyl-CoA dehydrogenase|nr:acyl-CoA dehydrogenase family protein [Actinomycetota bacterium]